MVGTRAGGQEHEVGMLQICADVGVRWGSFGWTRLSTESQSPIRGPRESGFAMIPSHDFQASCARSQIAG